MSKGDNDRVECRHHSGGPSLLGKIISTFANASGGRLILGVNNKGRIFGCKKEDVMETFNKSKEKLIPCPIVSIEFIEINKKVLATIISTLSFLRIGLPLEIISWGSTHKGYK
ncbi:AlbA family DNA-binding domain-containing protein [Clostridium tagluense]|uniref:AlbA family DNA-binding domain-containing protein n=1 Tax=Clostridium tagluense TaxID=360422 RepID=UPI001CF0E569|nr:ATP-binding protein [Clostridium tagluense]MCB2297569.1 ATP-binding protein [Clostridium tagluense]